VTEPVTGTSVVWFNTINGPCTNGTTCLLNTRGPSSAYKVAVVFGFNNPGDGGGGVFYWDRSGAIVCEAGPVHIGRTTHVWDAAVSHEETGRLLATFRCTQLILMARPE
jgi:hypothetical protein